MIDAPLLGSAPTRLRTGKRTDLPLALRPATVRWFLVVLLVAVVEALVRFGFVGATVVPAPSAIAGAIVASFASGEAVRALGRTVAEIAISSAVSLVAGVGVGLAIWRWGAAREIVQPGLITLYAVPLVFFYPILLAVFGIGIGPVLVVSILTGIVPVALNTMIGLLEMQPVWVKTARAYNVRPLHLFTKVYFPGAAHFFFAGVRLGMTYITIGVIAMEFITADAGLGYMARYYKEQFQAPKTYGYVVLVFLLAMLLDYLLRRLSARVQRSAA